MISLQDAQALLQKHRLVSLYHIKLKDGTPVERLRKRVARRYPDLTLSTCSEFADKQQMVAMMKGFGLAVAALAVVVGGVGMMNTVLMSVYERTREIGVLRALGWRRGRVLRMILKESLLLSGISGLVGIALGIGLGKALGLIASVAAFVQTTFTWQLFAQAMIASLVLGVLGGLYPAWWAAKLAPVEALRYE